MIHDSSNLSNKIYIGHAAYSLAYSILHAHYRPAPPNSPTDQPADQPTNQPTSQPDTNPIHPCPPACCHLHGCWVLFMGSQPRAHVHRACTPTSHAMHRALPQRMLCSCNNNQSTNQRGNHQPASQPASQPELAATHSYRHAHKTRHTQPGLLRPIIRRQRRLLRHTLAGLFAKRLYNRSFVARF